MRIFKRILSIILACMFIVGSFSTTVGAESDYYTGIKSEKTLWSAGQAEGEERAYTKHRIPGIVVTKMDTVIVYCEARTNVQNSKYSGTGEDWNLMDIYIQRSTDGGKTFGNPIYIARGDANHSCVNNPVMIVGNNNTLHMLYCKDYSIGGGGIWYRKSTDDGLTWSTERNLTEYTDSLGFSYNCFAFGPTHGICTSDETLMVPVWLVNSANGSAVTYHGGSSSHVFYSTDNGATWDITEERIFGSEYGVSEMCIAELSDGSILINGRSGMGKRALADIKNFNASKSAENIRLHEQLLDPNCCGGMTTVNIAGLPNALLYIGCNDTSKRQNVTVWCSFDDGKTFGKSLQLSSAEKGGYCDIAVDSTGKVYAIWEIDDGESVMLTTFSYANNFTDHGKDKTWYDEAQTEFTISTSAQLLGFADLIGEGKTFKGKTVNIAQNISIPTGIEWQDMGGKSFAGTLDGNGNTISGLHMTSYSAGCGFFGNVGSYGTTVKNLCVKDSSITTTDVDQAHCGGFFGVVNGYCSIENTYADIDITAAKTASTPDVHGIGGFIGCAFASASLNIKNSVSVGELTTKGNVAMVGGLVGLVDSGDGSANVNITDSAVYGTVKANGNSTGLIVGRAKSGGTRVALTNVIAAATLDITTDYTAHGAFAGAIQGGAAFKIASSVYTANKAIGSGNATDPSDYSSTTLNELKKTVPTDFKTWIIDANRNNGYLLPINVAYMLKHVSEDTADDGYSTAFAGYQSTAFKDGFCDIRLIGVVNDIDKDGFLDDEYTAGGFEVEMLEYEWSNKTDDGKAPQITTVYTSVLDGDTPISASELGGDYVFVATVTGVKQNVGNVTFVVKTFHDTDEGRYYDDFYVITYNTVTFSVNTSNADFEKTVYNIDWENLT